MMQMNGAELPCGTVIGVQPADMDYKSKKSKDDGSVGSRTQGSAAASGRADNCTLDAVMKSTKTTNNASAETTGERTEMLTAPDGFVKAEEKTATADEDDLDDFFASLE